jgi:MMP 1-O-methyltransferase
MTSLLRTLSRKGWKRLLTWNDTPFVRKYGKAYREMQTFREVEGFLSEREAMFLYDTAKAVTAPAPVVVEIGSFLGKSSVAISHALAGKSGAKMYCIDPFDASGDAFSTPTYQVHQERVGHNLLAAFQANIRKYGRPELIEAIQGYSYDVVKGWNKPIDFLFIDAAHDYEDVLHDFTEWAPHVKIGGIIAFHDVRLELHSMDLSGPAQVVRDHLFKNPAWEAVTEVLADSIYAVRRRS